MIYLTPFTNDPRETTAPSVPAGFDTLDDVVAAMGEPLSKRPPYLVYAPNGPEGNDRLLFSRFPWA